MKLLQFVPSTTGEVLFHFILRELYQPRCLAELQGLNILSIGGRTDFFAEYFLGISALNTLTRCIKKAERIRGIEDEIERHPRMVAYLQDSLGIARHGDETLDQLARLSLQAASDSKRPIKDSVKRTIRNGLTELPCYICGAMCRRNSTDEKESIEYEHLWPASFGGNSVLDNILPACWACNKAKDDMLLWHTGHLFSFVLKPDPSQEELKSISRREKVAAHMRLIFDKACEDRTSLKAAATMLGSSDTNSIYALDSADAMDFHNFQFR